MQDTGGSFLTDRAKNAVTNDMIDEDGRTVESNPMINKIYRNPRTAFQTKLEYFKWGYGGFVRHQTPNCPKRILEETEYCVPIKGAGSSRRCPNTNRGCQMFFNYQKFLQCYNRFEFKGYDGAMEKCGFFLRGVHPKLVKLYHCNIFLY